MVRYNQTDKNSIKALLSNWQHNTIKTAAELKEAGFYDQLLNKYSTSGWLDNPAYGIYKKVGDKVSWCSAIHVLQQQGFQLHVGAISALSLHGLIQYVTFNRSEEKICILNTSNTKKTLPKWLYKIVKNCQYVQVSLFNKNIYGITPYTEDNITINISSQERAVLEMLYFIPKYMSYEHAYELVEGAMLLRPEIMQALLEDCKSIKVKRLFLFMADKHNLPCFEQLDLSKIYLGAGDREIAGGGKYSAKYKISVPIIYNAEDESGMNYV